MGGGAHSNFYRSTILSFEKLVLTSGGCVVCSTIACPVFLVEARWTAEPSTETGNGSFCPIDAAVSSHMKVHCVHGFRACGLLLLSFTQTSKAILYLPLIHSFLHPSVYIAQAGLELRILLPRPVKCRDSCTDHHNPFSKLLPISLEI